MNYTRITGVMILLGIVMTIISGCGAPPCPVSLTNDWQDSNGVWHRKGSSIDLCNGERPPSWALTPGAPTPLPTFTPTRTWTPSLTWTPTRTLTLTITLTPTRTPTNTPTITPSPLPPAQATALKTEKDKEDKIKADLAVKEQRDKNATLAAPLTPSSTNTSAPPSSTPKPANTPSATARQVEEITEVLWLAPGVIIGSAVTAALLMIIVLVIIGFILDGEHVFHGVHEVIELIAKPAGAGGAVVFAILLFSAMTAGIIYFWRYILGGG